MAVVHVLFVTALLPLFAVIHFIYKAANFTNMRHSSSQTLLLIGNMNTVELSLYNAHFFFVPADSHIFTLILTLLQWPSLYYSHFFICGQPIQSLFLTSLQLDKRHLHLENN